MLIEKKPVQCLWLWILFGGSTSCGGQTGDFGTTGALNPPRITSGGSTFSMDPGMASGGFTSSVGGTVNSGGALATGASLGMGGTGCYPVLSNVDAGPLCGNGIVDMATAEGCDDGNRLSGDGCSANCQVEPSWVCPTVCRPCVITIVCGDGKVGPGEICDDGNLVAGDGCDGRCQIEPGFACPIPGKSCIALVCDAGCCGDGMVELPETCDDGINDGSYGGCAPNCRAAAHCGDGVVNGPEECDDGINDSSYGGCTSVCRLAPYCGDGVINGPEMCDDGSLNGLAESACTAHCKRYISPPV